MDHGAPTDVTRTYTRRYVYDGEEILLEYSGENELLARCTHSGLAMDDVLAVDVTAEGEAQKLVDGAQGAHAGSYFYLKDVLGTIKTIVDGSSNRVQHYVYSVYGHLLAVKNALDGDVTASPLVRTAYSFAGREFDSESGYYYFRARYYDPAIGRFLQKDPKPGKLEAPETFANAYAYVANNPVNISDPTGESFWDDLFDFVIGVVVGIAAVFTGGAAAGALVGLLGIESTILGGVVGAVAGAVVGAATGFIIGGFATGAYYAATGRDFSEGFFKGAIKGAIAGGMAGLIAGFMRGMEMAKEISGANKPGSNLLAAGKMGGYWGEKIAFCSVMAPVWKATIKATAITALSTYVGASYISAATAASTGPVGIGVFLVGAGIAVGGAMIGEYVGETMVEDAFNKCVLADTA